VEIIFSFRKCLFLYFCHLETKPPNSNNILPKLSAFCVLPNDNAFPNKQRSDSEFHQRFGEAGLLTGDAQVNPPPARPTFTPGQSVQSPTIRLVENGKISSFPKAKQIFGSMSKRYQIYFERESFAKKIAAGPSSLSAGSFFSFQSIYSQTICLIGNINHMVLVRK